MDSSTYKPVIGRTYSLFGEGNGTDEFYRSIRELADKLMREHSLSELDLLEYIRTGSRNKVKLRKAAGKNPGDTRFADIVLSSHAVLSPFMTAIDELPRSVPPYKRITDRELLTTREQYYFYMIEFELVNLICREKFFKADYRIALLPYCLKETHTECRARPDETDFRCMGCLKTCYINKVSSKLREFDINPYILSRGRIGTLLKQLHARHESIGVLGVACVVELVMGMRLCMKAKIPVVGLPVNANRCPRWMGTMHDTSIDLAALERLMLPITHETIP